MGPITPTAGLAQMAAAQSTWVRRNAVIWSDIEPSEGNYDWSVNAALENELINAANNGMQVILIVRSTPSWAQAIPGMYCGPIRQGSLAAFGNFMRNLVARYSVPPYNVKYWEIWNEPDVDPSYFAGDPATVFGCWGNQNDPYYGGGYYAQMLKTVYPQIKTADPDAQVMVGGLLLDCDPRSSCAAVGSSDRPPKFLEGILRNGGGPYFDGVSIHAYDYYQHALGRYSSVNWSSSWNSTGPAIIAKTNFIRSVLSTYGVTGKFLMNTETALLCDWCTNDSTFETTKAYFVSQVYASAIAQGLQANVWYSVLGWHNSGFLDSSTLDPLPAYTAFQFARTELRSATFIRNVTEYANVMGYAFYRGDRDVWVLWSLDGAGHNVALPGTPLAVWDALGNSVAPTSSVTIDLTPLYLEWP